MLNGRGPRATRQRTPRHLCSRRRHVGRGRSHRPLGAQDAARRRPAARRAGAMDGTSQRNIARRVSIR
eukprot:scaffold4673_cov282-Prasinococcus_capsulatus_cf.AAC.1